MEAVNRGKFGVHQFVVRNVELPLGHAEKSFSVDLPKKTKMIHITMQLGHMLVWNSTSNKFRCPYPIMPKELESIKVYIEGRSWAWCEGGLTEVGQVDKRHTSKSIGVFESYAEHSRMEPIPFEARAPSNRNDASLCFSFFINCLNLGLEDKSTDCRVTTTWSAIPKAMNMQVMCSLDGELEVTKSPSGYWPWKLPKQLWQ